MAVIETWLQTDLKKPVQVKQLGGHLFSADNQGNLIGVVIKDNGIPAEGLSGGVFGYAIRPDNETVVIEGTLSGNRASILLPASCYAIVGPISIVIKLGTTTIGACTGNVYRTTTDTIVDPGSVIPDISELLAKIADCEAATVRANTASDGAEKVNASMSKSGGVITIAVTDRDGVVTEEELTDQSNAVAELEKAVQAQGIYIETESQPIVSISDGADDQPMKSVKVAIEPAQDLHGYEYPWPAGGGKNLIPPIETTTNYGVTFTQDGDYINISGTPSANAYCVLFDGVLPTGTYTFNGVTGASSTSYRTGLKIADSTSWSYNTENQKTFTLEADSQVKIWLFAYPGYGTFDNFKVQYQLERGDTVTPWTPYSNICPISGWTGAKVTRTGKNLFDKNISRTVNKLRDDNGVEQATSSSSYTADFGGIEPGTTYTLSGTITKSTGNGRIYFLDQYHNWISRSNGFNQDRMPYTFTTPANCKYLAIQYLNTASDLDDLQLEIGSVATEYESFGQTHEVTFPANPGTVYGGTLDVVSGKLVVDRVILETTWGAGGNTTEYDDRTRKRWAPNPTPDTTHLSSALCNLATYQDRTAPEINRFDLTKSYLYLSLAKDTDDATPIQVCYHIASPQEIALTPTEIKTLLGINNVWSDAGNTSITYPADTKTYIDNRINSTRRLIAGIETGFTASKAYAVGDMLIIGDDLYKVASSIASGATITVGTNVTKTTVAEQLLALMNA